MSSDPALRKIAGLIREEVALAPPDTWDLDECLAVLGVYIRINEGRKAAIDNAGENVVQLKRVRS